MRRPSPVPRLAGALALAAMALAGGGCGGRDTGSPAADALIAQASDEEEREGLTRARYDIDAPMRERADALDEEIERLRRENEELRRHLER